MNSGLMGNDQLAMSVTHTDGHVTRWGPDEPDPINLPGDLTFSTQIPGGFKDLSCSLLRRIDLEYADLSLFDTVRVYGAGNRTAWEGRMEQFPRSHGDGYQIVPGAVGWSAHLADDQSFREIYVDRDLGSWGQASVQRAINLNGAFMAPVAPTVVQDDTTGQPSLFTGYQGSWVATAKLLSEGWYGQGIPIGSVFYAWKRHPSVINTDTNWLWAVQLSTDDLQSVVNTNGNERAAGPTFSTVSATGATKYFAEVQTSYAAANSGSDGQLFGIYWTCLAVYGTHGLTKRGTASATNANGFYASDVIQNIVTRTAPLLTIGEIQATTFVIPHLVFFDPTTGEEAIQFVNAYHGFPWGVYDNKTFFWRDWDASRLTWQARLSTGARLDLEGDTAGQVFNGVYVTYQDATGQKKTVGPSGASADATDASLADTSSTNPVNSHGITRRWAKLEISQTTTQAGAIQLGAIWLAEHAAPQRRGTLTLTGTVTHPTEGEVPVWRVRAGDYVSITDHPADVPRKIIETRYTHGTRQLVCSLDNTPFLLDAILQRLGVGLVGVL